MKEGFLTREEAKVLGSLVTEQLPLGKFPKKMISVFMPTIIDTVDNKFAKRVPEPWKTNISKLASLVCLALEDFKVDKEEMDTIVTYCAEVMNTHIEIPWFEEDDEAIIFITGWQHIAAIIRNVIKQKTK